MPRPFLYLCLLLTAVSVGRAGPAPPPGEWDVVSVAAGKTSIYVGTVTLITSDFHRDGDIFTATYQAKVRPWFFWSESGRIAITLPQAKLEQLARGERIEFEGEAYNHKEKPRRVTGRADRTDPATGTIKVRIAVDDTTVIFNTTYRFTRGKPAELPPTPPSG